MLEEIWGIQIVAEKPHQPAFQENLHKSAHSDMNSHYSTYDFSSLKLK